MKKLVVIILCVFLLSAVVIVPTFATDTTSPSDSVEYSPAFGASSFVPYKQITYNSAWMPTFSPSNNSPYPVAVVHNNELIYPRSWYANGTTDRYDISGYYLESGGSRVSLETGDILLYRGVDKIFAWTGGSSYGFKNLSPSTYGETVGTAGYVSDGFNSALHNTGSVLDGLLTDLSPILTILGITLGMGIVGFGISKIKGFLASV